MTPFLSLVTPLLSLVTPFLNSSANQACPGPSWPGPQLAPYPNTRIFPWDHGHLIAQKSRSRKHLLSPLASEAPDPGGPGRPALVGPSQPAPSPGLTWAGQSHPGQWRATRHCSGAWVSQTPRHCRCRQSDGVRDGHGVRGDVMVTSGAWDSCWCWCWGWWPARGRSPRPPRSTGTPPTPCSRETPWWRSTKETLPGSMTRYNLIFTYLTF